MKKNTKTASSPAPAKKSVKSTKVSAPAKVVKSVVKTAKPAAVKPAKLVKKPVAAPVREIKKTAPASVLTTIVADIDVGFGNSLYIRGEGPGLSWEKGVLLSCVSDDKWSIALPETARPVVLKIFAQRQYLVGGRGLQCRFGPDGHAGAAVLIKRCGRRERPGRD